MNESICYPAALMSHRCRPKVGVTNWDPTDHNQYLERMMSALQSEGIAVSPVRIAPLAVARKAAFGMRAVHLHWPEYFTRPFNRTRVGAALNLARLARLAAGLAACRLLRVRVVWTVHNLAPHEAHAAWAAFRAYPLVARFADVFVAHSHAAARRVQARFPRAEGRLLVAAHGNYVGAHPRARTPPADVRARYGVPPEAFLLLAFGQVRRYKRLAELSRAVAAMNGADVHLLIAGAALEDGVPAELESVAGRCDRIHLDLRRIPGDQVSDLYGASDAAVFNHAELFSSGSLLLALSQGLPVVTARSDAASEVAGWPAVSGFDGDAEFLEAIERLRAVDPALRRAAALDAAAAASWERAAAALRVAYG